MNFMTIVIGALGKVTKELVKGLEELEISGPVETTQISAFFDISLNTDQISGDLLSCKLLGLTISWHWCEKL